MERGKLEKVVKSERKSPSMLEPRLNLKVDELFVRWISLLPKGKIQQNLKQIKAKKDENTENVPKSKPEKNLLEVSLPQPVKDDAKPMVSPRRRTAGKTRTSLEKLNSTWQSSPENLNNNNHDFVVSVKSKKNKNLQQNIPRFYFPKGRPDKSNVDINWEEKVSLAFSNANTKRVTLSEMGPVCSACGCPIYWKSAIFHKAVKRKSDSVTEMDVIASWRNVISGNYDEPSRFVALLAKEGQNVLEFSDFLPLMRDIVDTHPGLSFLREAPEFHTRYMNTVIARIFYTVNRSWSGKLTANELRKSNFLPVLASLENEPDINMVTDYFSYEHFYVIYCKFWELDTDHDLVIDRNDLARHGDGVLCSRLIDRVLSGAVTRWNDPATRIGCMSYIDFVWFLISEEDKTTNTSTEYWFRCMDLDGDGYISLYEMEYFYEEQMRKLELLDVEALPFDDCACQMLDMIKPLKPECISLGDLKRSHMAGTFFDTFFNIEKYLEREQKDPFANAALDESGEGPDLPKESDWDKFASEEYEILVAEEQANERKSCENSLNDDLSDLVLEEELKDIGIISEDPLNAKFGGISSADSSLRPNSPASLTVNGM